MMGGALPAFAAAQYDGMNLRCSLTQAAYANCLTCACAATNTCQVNNLHSDSELPPPASQYPPRSRTDEPRLVICSRLHELRGLAEEALRLLHQQWHRIRHPCRRCPHR